MYKQLSTATSIDEIVRVTRDYLSSWSREELERLPDSCRPAWIRNHEDIEFWADRLAAESEKAVLFLEDERRLDRLTSHFLIASVRIRQLAPDVDTAAAA
jgi:hypothetical protein